MNSLRARLVGFTLLAVGIIWLATAYTVWHKAHHELHELLDKPAAASNADAAHERGELEESIAEHLAEPLLIAFPLLAVVLAVAVTLALRPLRRLTDEVSARAPERLEPLALAGAPAEVRPLIKRLNHLFADIGRALDNERRFTADAAHELRTPLAAVKAQAQVAQSAVAEDVRQHALAQIIAGCDRATQLTVQLLMLARLDAAHGAGAQAIELNALTTRVLAELAGDAVARGNTLAWTEGNATTVMGDEALFAVLLRNLVDNALRHNPPGTHVEVALTHPDGRPTLSVSDNGPGVAAADAMEMTQRFRRGEGSSGEGSGLGLSIVQRIAELHDAEFRLMARGAGGGTTAVLQWPAAPATQP